MVAAAPAQGNSGLAEPAPGATLLLRGLRTAPAPTSTTLTTEAAAADPAPAVPVLNLTSITPTEDGWRISFIARAGWHYQVEQSSDLTGPWQTVSPPVPCFRTPLNEALLAMHGATVQHQPMSIEVLDPAGRLPARCFWRVVERGALTLPAVNPFTGITTNTNTP